MKQVNDIAVIIPSLSPDEKLFPLLDGLREAGISHLIIVNDGSTEEYDSIFTRAKDEYGCTLLRHHVNQGKGRAIKTAFHYLLNELPECKCAVTVDSDGQHSVKDTLKCAQVSLDHPEALVLGCRDFSGDQIPARSKFGNQTTCKVIQLFCGIKITDTQTGLRGFSRKLMKQFLSTKGERFEFETNMLLDTKEWGIPIVEVPIETIYIEENKSSHFNPLKDSLRIYAVFLKFLLASASSFLVDILLFSLFVRFSKGLLPNTYILTSTVGARIISAFYNYLVNKNGVFRSNSRTASAMTKYAILCVAQLCASAGLVTLFVRLIGMNETVCKMFVDAVLFVISFQIQREWVFK